MNLSTQSFIGNAELFGSPHLGFSPCLNKSHPCSRHLLKFLLPPIVLAFSTLAICVYLLIGKKHKKDKASGDMTDATSHQLVSYRELVHATRNFSDDTMLGSGGFGKVFMGQLKSGLVVAIKVLDMKLEHAKKIFDAECHAQPHKNTQHMFKHGL